MSYFSIHNHSEYSNLRMVDAISKPKELIEYANEIGLQGISLSDHEALSGHVKYIQAYKELRDAGKLHPNFKIALGNEIYLVREDNLEELQENYSQRLQDTQFFHFLLTALNEEGHEQLRELSSLAWENFYKDGFMVRVPTFKKDMKRIIQGGHVVATSACLGGELPQLILRWKEAERDKDQEIVSYYKREIHEFITYCIEVFGKEKFFLEIQPSEDNEQHLVNRELIELSKVYGLDYLVATDSHFIEKDDRHAHKVYLQSSQADREVDAFYSSCYIFSASEIRKTMANHLTLEEIEISLSNTLKVHEMVEFYDLKHETIIPHATVGEFELNHLFKPAYDQYNNIKNFAYSKYEIDRYLLYLLEEGFKEHFQSPELTRDKLHEILKRIDIELGELWKISKRLGDRLSSYYVLTREIVLEIIWDKADSLCGVARGSAAGYLINMLLNITQIDPLQYDLPHFRHLTAERPELPDIDLDSEQSKRGAILDAMKDKYGERNVLNIATFSREGSRSALLSACRGMGIDIDDASYLTSLVPSARGRERPLYECFHGTKEGDPPVYELVNAVEEFEGLKEVILKIEGIVKNNSVHASGIYIFNEGYTRHNAMMKSSTELATTQFDMDDSDYMSALKIDALTVQNLDKIRTSMDMLIEDGYMDWQGSLIKTYNKYLHPKVLEYEDKEMWELVSNNLVPDIFQFDSPVGLQAAQKVKPTNVSELASANNLMRLMAEGEQPVDKYVRFKEDNASWIAEMKKYGLTEDEIEVVKEHLEDTEGVSNSQEEIMLLTMDERIAGFTVTEANTLRRAVASINAQVLEEVRELFFTKGQQRASIQMLNYIWDLQIMPQAGYGFSDLHSYSYSLMALQNMNLAHNYPSIYWSTACLSVNSGADETSDANKASNYGKVAIAIGEMQARGVEIRLPDINEASFGFVPDPETNSVVFGLRGIHGIGTEIVRSIIENRPYSSLEDFLIKMFDTKLLQNNHVLQLIRAGSFDSFGGRKEIMKEYLLRTSKTRKKLTLASFNLIIQSGIVPKKFDLHVRFFNYRRHIFQNPIKRSKERKTKNRLFLLDEVSTDFLFEYFSEDCIVDFDEETGRPIVGEWLFDREYEKKMQPVREWLDMDDTVKKMNQIEFMEEWNKATSGSLARDEMSSLTYYYSEHELAHLNKEKYGVKDFYSLPKDPEVTREYEYRGRTRYEYEVHRIAGTVLDKDKNRNTVTILTTDGVVVVKLFRSNYGKWDRQISRVGNDGKKTVLEPSWFTRGNLLLFTGYRRGNQFTPRTFRSSIYQNPVMKINHIDNSGDVSLSSERIVP